MKCLLLVLMGLSLAGAAHPQTTISQLFAFGGPDGVEPSVLIQASDGEEQPVIRPRSEGQSAVVPREHLHKRLAGEAAKLEDRTGR